MADQFATPVELAGLLQSDLDAYTANLLLDLATGIVQGAIGGQRLIEVTDTALIDVLSWDEWLDLPQLPVRSVSTVVLDGTAITDWRLRSQRLWRLNGWQRLLCEPSQVAVTYSHGYPVDSPYMATAKAHTLSLAQAGYGNPSVVESETIDDYRVSYAEALARMELTEPMRAQLVARYGNPAVVTTSQRS
jgi:hypothetical protein